MTISSQIACYESERNASFDGTALGKYMRVRYLGEASHLKTTQHGAAIFSVEDSQGGKLGTIKWYGRWNRYCFYPCEAVFSADCLEEVVRFMGELW